MLDFAFKPHLDELYASLPLEAVHRSCITAKVGFSIAVAVIVLIVVLTLVYEASVKPSSTRQRRFKRPLKDY